ncbi:T9SS-dependent M36 family metallopeptidase [Flavobacterium sp. SUN046]|uniref:T9SS-dependent M36 family metallopeptidase n=1 Tax=Flavobacterium sp. SUN046 TaxID=3002440 RepID=UPI002DB9E722|nr:T9SS-dependent M36 family metallopeptidase [Flavobacterium sp. SUN046]MEC4047897.1 T9SS-dependent M36 family metallopeptidase [Flavobacterium sp. SUN046]
MKKIALLLVFLTSALGYSQDMKAKIQSYLEQNKTTLKLNSQDISDWFIESDGNSDVTKIDNYFIKQRYQNIEIYNAVSNVWVKNGEVINVANRFLPNISQKVNTTTPSLTALQALNKAFALVDVNPSSNEIIETIGANEFKISNGALTEDPIHAELVYQVVKNNLKLAWNFTFYTPDYKHLWDIRIDAVNGSLLGKNDMVISCGFDNHGASAQTVDKSTLFNKSFFKDEMTSPLQIQGGSYRVIPYNYVSPLETARVLISNPENATASPKGWHDANTLSGTTTSLKYTYTRGNNVWARSDYTGANPTSASTVSTANGYAPDGGTALSFDFTYPGNSAQPKTYINAACTNLFYMNNVCHDLWYLYGFDEANGNYQQDNHGMGASAGDYVYADAQDGSTATTPTLNNSNFSAPVDGSKGRMQMFLWNIAPTYKPLFVISPETIAGNYNSKQNAFTAGHVDLPIAPAAIQSDLVLYDDGTADPGYSDNADACEAAINASAISGHVALVRRSLAAADGGTPCNFTVKVKNAQLAGATAVIVYNNVDVTDSNGDPVDVPLGMSGADATITIPAISVSKIIGDMLHDQLASGPVNVKLQLPADYVQFVNADGNFDNGVIAHEFGHGISIRLAGGRNNSSCLNNDEQMGEGWSDWFALMFQIHPGDVGTTAKGIGNFVVSQPANGPGIRNYPYSTDMTINPETFNTVNLNQVDNGSGTMVTETHNVGEVWATMLWDLTWAYIAKYGYDDNKYTGTGGNNKVMRLVLDAIKLQPCSPSFVDARDAIIAADQATTGGQDYCMIWQVFARRGLGVNANSGDAFNSIDEVEDFTQPAPGPNCVLSVNYFDNEELFRVYPNPTNGSLNLRINNYVGKVSIQIIDINGRLVNDIKNEDFNIEKTLNLNALQTGVYILKVSGDNINFTQKIIKE